MITNNLSFKGYKNVFAAFDVPFANSNKAATIITMQLNDEDGYKDLTEFRKLKHMQGDIINEKFGDIVTLSYIVDKEKRNDHLYLDIKEMYWGDELLTIKENYIPKIMSQERYKQEESLHMKAYTLLASLTKRMMFDAFDKEDGGRVKVIERMYNTIYALVKNQQEAYRIVETACLKRVKFSDVAAGFNKDIADTMSRFFR